MRIYFYVLAGITSALVGWSIGQFFLSDLRILTQFPEVILFPCVAASLAVGMVLNEIFTSNPTRYKINLRIAKTPVLIAVGLGGLAGLMGGVISQILFLPALGVPANFVRTLGWLVIGGSVGISEGLSWMWHSMEAGDSKRFQKRLRTSFIGASIGSLTAAGLFELTRGSLNSIPSWEDPLGFSILGIVLGLVFSLTNSPSYMAALRAGAGFEYSTYGTIRDLVDDNQQLLSNHDDDDEGLNNGGMPYIDKSLLRFVSNGDSEEIEEGLSIQLPSDGNIRIGSGEEAHIYLPGVAANVASLVVKQREVFLVPQSKHYKNIEVNGSVLTSAKQVSLKHNYVLTFRRVKGIKENEKQFYRFVYYNRFLDPQA